MTQVGFDFMVGGVVVAGTGLLGLRVGRRRFGDEYGNYSAMGAYWTGRFLVPAGLALMVLGVLIAITSFL